MLVDNDRPGTSTSYYDDRSDTSMSFYYDDHWSESSLLVWDTRCGTPCLVHPADLAFWMISDEAELRGPSADEILKLKEQGNFDHARKTLRKSSEWKIKRWRKDPAVLFDPNWFKRQRDLDVRNVRSHMTMHVRGGWQLKLEDDGRGEVEETDWIAEVESRPAQKEVALVDIAKPAKPRRHRQKAGDFEVVQGSRSVIALDDHGVPEPEPDEPWECLELEEDDTAARLTYAQVAVSFA